MKLSLDLPDDAEYIPLTRHFGHSLLEFLRVIPVDIGDVETIISELAANVIRHANSKDGRFQVLLEFYAERVMITVIDDGNGFTFRDIPEIGSPRRDLDGGERLGGFGLPLLDALSDRLDFGRTDPKGTTVRAEKALRYATRPDEDRADNMNAKDVKVTVKNA